MKRHIPNTITCCNLICGCIATYFVLQPVARYDLALAFIVGGAVFDFFDGFILVKIGIFRNRDVKHTLCDLAPFLSCVSPFLDDLCPFFRSKGKCVTVIFIMISQDHLEVDPAYDHIRI